jgi:hypothetical protein
MKRRILITVLALLLALGALVTLNSSVSRTALPIEMQVLTSLGDSSAAQGLTVDYRIALDSCLRWYTKYDPASGANSTDFHVTGNRNTTTVLPYYSLLGETYNDWWIVSGLLNGRDTRDPIVSGIRSEAASGQGRANSRGTNIMKRLYPIDYYDSYPLRLSQQSVTEGISPDNSPGYYEDWVNIPFDKLRIPVTENDFFELEFRVDSTETGQQMNYVSGSGLQYVQNAFTPYCAASEDGVLVTVGFPADVQPEADWAPEGFGLWYMPVRMQEVTDERSGASGTVSYSFPVVAECRLVYPLDIGTQRVMLLRRSDDGAHILLVTAENDRYVLRVLDSGDYHLVRKIELCEATAHEYTETSYIYEDYGPWREPTESAHYRYNYPDENDRGTAEFQVTRTAYPEVSMQQGDNFAAVIIGSRLALLTPSAEGYDLQFVCDTVSYGYEMWKDDPDNTYWYQEDLGWLFTGGVPSDPNSSVYQAYTVATVEERYAMAYNGTSLAVATYYGNRLMLSVYGPDGFQYAALVKNNVLGQIDSTGTANPVCQDELRSYQEYYYPQPGLSWS